jgi:hypothetical protein
VEIVSPWFHQYTTSSKLEILAIPGVPIISSTTIRDIISDGDLRAVSDYVSRNGKKKSNVYSAIVCTTVS